MNPSRFVTPDNEVEIHLPDGRTLRGPRGATARDLLQPVVAALPAPLMGVVVNGDLQELGCPITMEARIRPVTMADADGARIYRRSLTFLPRGGVRPPVPQDIAFHRPLARVGRFLLQRPRTRVVDCRRA